MASRQCFKGKGGVCRCPDCDPKHFFYRVWPYEWGLGAGGRHQKSGTVYCIEQVHTMATSKSEEDAKQIVAALNSCRSLDEQKIDLAAQLKSLQGTSERCAKGDLARHYATQAMQLDGWCHFFTRRRLYRLSADLIQSL